MKIADSELPDTPVDSNSSVRQHKYRCILPVWHLPLPTAQMLGGKDIHMVFIASSDRCFPSTIFLVVTLMYEPGKERKPKESIPLGSIPISRVPLSRIL